MNYRLEIISTAITVACHRDRGEKGLVFSFSPRLKHAASL